MVEGSDCPLLCSLKAPPEVLCPGLGPQHKKAAGMDPEEEHKDDQRTKPPLLRRQVEQAPWLVQPGEKKASGVAFQYLKGTKRKDGEGICIRQSNDRTRVNGFKLKEGRFRQNFKKKFFAT